MPSESDSVSTLESASSCWYATYRLPWLADRRSALDEAKVVSVKATAAQTSGGTNFFIRELECLDFIVVQLIQPRRLPCGARRRSVPLCFFSESNRPGTVRLHLGASAASESLKDNRLHTHKKQLHDSFALELIPR